MEKSAFVPLRAHYNPAMINSLPTPPLLPLLLGACLSLNPLLSASPKVLTEGNLPNDRRLGPLNDLDGYFPFEPSANAAEWNTRAASLRRHILVTQGLWPMPAKEPLNTVIHGRIDQGDYTVEKVYFESRPNYFVTGSLYRPKDKPGRLPAVLSPHGHWSAGRFYDNEGQIQAELQSGAEKFENGGRSPLQARCVQLARMGCVVFHYDMIGYADNQQISFDVAHRFSKQRPEMNSAENWGLYSPQAEAHFQSVMGLQTWNTIRSLDFLASLPDVDPERIAVTGASGGGTQTFILCAIDPRPAVSFPAVMVSTAMQGGCTCENACNLRIGTGNVEFAALFAPKPLGLTAADDWTKEMETKGFPQLKKHFEMLGAGDRTQLTSLTQFGHNYNHASRAAMYEWLNQHLDLGHQKPIVEADYPRLSAAELTVWDSAHPQPAGGPEFERGLLGQFHKESEEQIEKSAQSPVRFQELAGAGIDVVLGRTLAEAGDVDMEMTSRVEREGYLEMAGLLRNRTYKEELPVVFLHPANWNKRTVIWIDPAGKRSLYDGERPAAPIRKLLEAGMSVAGVDLLMQGEFVADETLVARTRRVNNNREAAAYTFGYNPTLFAQRVHDILTTIRFVREHERGTRTVELIGLNGAGPWVAAARAQAGAHVDRAVIDTRGFRFGNVREIHDVDFLPGGAKYGDLPGMLAKGAPATLLLAGEGAQAPALVEALYRNTRARDQLTLFGGEQSEAVEWLINPPTAVRATNERR